MKEESRLEQQVSKRIAWILEYDTFGLEGNREIRSFEAVGLPPLKSARALALLKDEKVKKVICPVLVDQDATLISKQLIPILSGNTDLPQVEFTIGLIAWMSVLLERMGTRAFCDEANGDLLDTSLLNDKDFKG